MYFEDFYIGQHFECGTVTMTEAEITEFAGKYDPLPIHVDKEFARNGHFNDIVASGFHTLCAVWSQWVIQKKLTHEVIGGLSIDNTKWLVPVRPNDTLSVVAEVISLVPSKTAGRGVFGLRVTAVNQKEQVVMIVESSALIKCRPGSAAY
ncbi:MAG: MaoC/PaaZ C-terminal domain-containing protein [Pseudomonadota bacterium]